MAVQKAYSSVIIIPESLFHLADSVVFAAESHHEYSARVGVLYESGKRFLCFFEIGAELAAPELVCKAKRARFFGYGFRRAVYAPDGGNHPYLVANPHAAVRAKIAVYHYGLLRLGDGKPRLVLVFERAREERFQVVCVYPFALFYIAQGLTYRKAVLYHFFALLYVAHRVFVSVFGRYGDIVLFVYQDKLHLIASLIPSLSMRVRHSDTFPVRYEISSPQSPLFLRTVKSGSFLIKFTASGASEGSDSL